MSPRRTPAGYGPFATAIAHAVEQALGDARLDVDEPSSQGLVGPDAAYQLVAAHLTREPGTPVVVTLIIERVSQRARSALAEPTSFGLTEREATVANLLRQGRSNAAIAAALSISAHTVKRHIERILAKLNVNTRAQAALVLSGVAAAPDAHLQHSGRKRRV